MFLKPNCPLPPSDIDRDCSQRQQQQPQLFMVANARATSNFIIQISFKTEGKPHCGCITKIRSVEHKIVGQKVK